MVFSDIPWLDHDNSWQFGVMPFHPKINHKKSVASPVTTWWCTNSLVFQLITYTISTYRQKLPDSRRDVPGMFTFYMYKAVAEYGHSVRCPCDKIRLLICWLLFIGIASNTNNRFTRWQRMCSLSKWHCMNPALSAFLDRQARIQNSNFTPTHRIHFSLTNRENADTYLQPRPY